jgi:DNA-binding CsgD family transcriptional regulator/tetratricopeptide (TPR) repeat protein
MQLRLRGRRRECEVLDDLLARVRTGQSGVLILRGEAGIGKTALLDRLADSAPGFRIVRAAGVESEMELAHAGLHQLCAPFADRIESLPGPQRDALGTAFGRRDGDAPNRFLVGLAVLGLLSEVAEEQPLLCIVDDAQWLDAASSQALAFVARRLGAESVAMVVSMRDPDREDDFIRLPQLVVHGLGERDARGLLETVLTGPLDNRVRDRLVAETRGNPLALLELPRGLTPAEMAGGFGLPDASSLTSRIEESFRRRLAPLPPSTRTLLLVASAEPVGDPAPVWRAARALGVEPAARGAAADLVEFGGQVRFRHPLVRSAVYRAASPEERERTHRALADATDPEVDPDRRAWHRAHATPVSDEDVAAELERSAGRAQGRGGVAAAAAFLERAAELTPEPARRARRALAAADRKQRAGAPDAALRLLGFAEAGPLDELDQVRVELLRGQVTFAVTRGGDAPQLLLQAAKRLESLDGALARETYLDAFAAALFADRLTRGVGVREIAEAVLAAEWGQASHRSPRAFDLLLEGIAVVTIDGYAAGVPTLKRALREFHDEPMSDEQALRWLWVACRAARALGDDAMSDELTERHVRLAREAGELSLLPIALAERFSLQLFLGNLLAAEGLVLETEVVAAATGSRLAPQGALLAALRGQEAEATALIDAGRREVVDRGEGLWLVITEWASAVLFNSLGRYEEALAAAEQAVEHPHEMGVSTWVQPEFIEAAARSGHPERAAGPLRRLQEISSAAGTDWALGVEARSRALLSEGDVAENLYREAIARLSRTRVRTAHARAHLVYGEWLRRERRRVEAREHLRIAHGMYAEIGMHGFAERARRERMATGETVRKRTPDTRDRLTAQEAQIARLAAEGCTNPEIGAQLFISPRTVEWHLRGVFTKLGIHSRKELRVAAQDPPSAVPATEPLVGPASGA